MQQKLKYFLCCLMALSCLEAVCQREKRKKHGPPPRAVVAKYEGGERNVIVLTLYSDSTFNYQEIGNVMGLKATKMGAYLMNDSTISLFTWRSYQFLRDMKEDSRSSVFRRSPEKILMFSREQEVSSDSSFYKSYFTLQRTQ